MRLVLPPPLLIALAPIVLTPIYSLFPYYVATGISAGIFSGYIAYDMTHYFLHHTPSFLKPLLRLTPSTSTFSYSSSSSSSLLSIIRGPLVSIGTHFSIMKKYHLDHHYKKAGWDRGFGITSKFWDSFFGTEL